MHHAPDSGHSDRNDAENAHEKVVATDQSDPTTTKGGEKERRESRYSNVDKQIFPTLLKRLHGTGAFSRVNAISGFEACRNYPLSREKITGDKLSTSIPLTCQSETSTCVSVDIQTENNAENAHEKVVATAQSDPTTTSRAS